MAYAIMNDYEMYGKTKSYQKLTTTAVAGKTTSTNKKKKQRRDENRGIGNGKSLPKH